MAISSSARRKASRLPLWMTAVFLAVACSPATQIPNTGISVDQSQVPPAAGHTQAPPTAVPTAIRPLSTSTVSPTGLAVVISDQVILDGTVTIQDVTSPGPGWLAVSTDANGKPGDIIGTAPLRSGDNRNVVVSIDRQKVTPALYASLYTDQGVIGKFEFPGPDVPAMQAGQPVAAVFHIVGIGQPASAPAASPSPIAGNSIVVKMASNPQLGKILVDAKGMTLYIYKPDAPGERSVCTGGCAENWPPLLADPGSTVSGDGLPGTLGTFDRSDRGAQVMYKKMPLYTFIGDQAPGEANGQGAGGVWFAATP